jgi:hypothetical protein
MICAILANGRKTTPRMHETITLPLHEARFKARQLLSEGPAANYVKIVENWRQLQDGRIQFTIRRLPAADEKLATRASSSVLRSETSTSCRETLSQVKSLNISGSHPYSL